MLPKTARRNTHNGRRFRRTHFGSVVGARINSVAYPVQRGAEALYSAEGRKQVIELIGHYMGNAKVLRNAAGDKLVSKLSEE